MNEESKERGWKHEPGIGRIASALACTMNGLAAAFRCEEAFRIEAALAVILVPTALLLRVSALEKAVMIACVLLVLLIELLNSALEALADRVSLERHPLAARAKDMGSAAVGLALVNAAAVWLLILLG